MRIQHNISAINAHRQLGNNNSSVSRNLEKLSSGYRINKAGDDAAGLAISEKMRAQIKGLDTAQKNAQDGISLIQTAEGALTEVHSMLNRMTELATQAANGTYDDPVDRNNLQKEVDSLKDEINRISDGTNYNGIKLLDGSLSAAKVEKIAGKDAAFTADAAVATAAGLSNVKIDGAADGDNVTISHTGAVAASAAKTANVTIAGMTAAKFTGGADSILNTHTIKIDIAVGATKAEVGADGNLAITLSATNNYANAQDLEDAINAAIAAATDAGGAPAGTVDAWKGVELDIGATGTFAAPAGSSVLATTAMSGGAAAAGEKITVTAGGVTGTAEAANGGSFADGDTLTFTGGLTGTATVDDITKFAAGITGIQVIGSVAATGAAQELDFTGKTGKDMIGATITYGKDAAGKDITYEFVKNANDVKQGNTAIVVADGDTDAQIATKVQAALTAQASPGAAAGEVDTVANNGAKVTITSGVTGAASKAPAVNVKGGLILQVGETSDDFNKVAVSVGNMSCEALGIDDVDISNQKDASKALDKIKAAINTVSTTRGNLGALQNRLDHTINNLGTASENMSAAESRIRDVDMAKEMMDFTKNNILTQASQAMLAQANQLPQGVLQLLQ